MFQNASIKKKAMIIKSFQEEKDILKITFCMSLSACVSSITCDIQPDITLILCEVEF